MDITDELSRFITQNESNGALLVTGKWGCGKTYLLRKIAEQYNAADKFLFVIVSLFGIDSVDSLSRAVKEKVFFAGLPTKTSTTNKLLTKVKNIGSTIASSLRETSIIAKGIDTVLSINWLDFVSVEKEVLCLCNNQTIKKRLVLVFDDFERSRLDRLDLMGAINEYSESKSITVLIVANEEEIPDDSYNDIKEKLISRTIHLSLDGKQIVNDIITSYNETVQDYKAFLQANSSIIYQAFIDSQSENIRSLKSTLIDFERVFFAWRNSKVPMGTNVENILYRFGAIEFEYKAGNYINAGVSYILHVNGDTEKSIKRKQIESKYNPDTFAGFLNSLSQWIVDGEWNEKNFVEEIRRRYTEEDLSPEESFIYHQFWDLQQEDIDIGLPVFLEKAYNGEATCDELIALIQKIHAFKEYGVVLPCEVDYRKLEEGFEKRMQGIRAGIIKEPARHTFSDKEQYDADATELYKKIENMRYRIHAWENEQLLISYLNNPGTNYYPLKNKCLQSFDVKMLDIFMNEYNKAQNGRKRELSMVLNHLCLHDHSYSTEEDLRTTKDSLTELSKRITASISIESDKMANAISTKFLEMLKTKIDQVSSFLPQEELDDK